MAVSVAAAVLVSLPFLFVLVRRPVLRRLALRNARRRPKEALLVVLGSMLGAAIITGSFVVGDTMNRSVRQLAFTHLGPVDELVAADDHNAAQQLTTRFRQRIPARLVDGVLPIGTLDVAATSSAHGTLLTSPRSQVVALDFAAARRFGGDARTTGIDGPTPPQGHAAVSRDLANALQLRRGDVFDLWAYGRSTHLFVDRILPRRGLAGFWLGDRQEAPNVLVSLDTLALVTAPSRSLLAERQGFEPPRWQVGVSNRGGVEDGAELTTPVTHAIERLDGGVAPLPVKRQALEVADAVGKAYSNMFTSMGTFGVLAGLLLLVNLFVMLAAERRSELGMARAVGMSRTALVGAFSTEGWLYALLAAALGALGGVGLGRLIIAASARAFSSEHNRFTLVFTARPGSIAAGFAIGLVASIVTIVLTAVRVGRLNVICAIRDLPEPSGRGPRRIVLLGGVFLAAVGLLWAFVAFPARSPWGLILAPILMLVGVGAALTRVLTPRRVALAVAAAAMVWSVVVFPLYGHAFKSAGVMVYVVQGVVLTASGVMIATLLQGRIARLLRAGRIGGRLAGRVGLAYPLARLSRTGLTVAMYALVVFILTFITTISKLIASQVDTTTQKLSGAYSVVVDSSSANPLPLPALAKRPGIWVVAPLWPIDASFTTPSHVAPRSVRVTAFGEGFLSTQPPELQDRGGYSDDRSAWTAVMHDPGLAIVDDYFGQQGGGPGATAKVGERFRIADPFTGKGRSVRVAAIASPSTLLANGVFYGRQGARAIFGRRLVSTRAYVALREGVDPDAFAAGVQSSYFVNGAEANSIRSLVDEEFAVTNQMFLLFQGYLAMGLVVGIAGLAVVMIRAVRERRRSIGTLRALGFQRGQVGRSFAIEAAFVSLEGTLLGCVLALVTLWNIVTRTNAFGEYSSFVVPVVPLVVLLGATVVASLAATLGPAVSASRTRPAVALRATD